MRSSALSSSSADLHTNVPWSGQLYFGSTLRKHKTVSTRLVRSTWPHLFTTGGAANTTRGSALPVEKDQCSIFMENIAEGTTDSNIEWFYQRNCWNLSHQSNIGNTKTQKRQIYFQIVAGKQNTPIVSNVWSTKTQTFPKRREAETMQYDHHFRWDSRNRCFQMIFWPFHLSNMDSRHNKLERLWIHVGEWTRWNIARGTTDPGVDCFDP